MFIRGTQQTVNAYFGTIFVGGPTPQEFSVVFDTGSGHVILPAATCQDTACRVHRRYNRSLSEIGVDIDADGGAVLPGMARDQVSVEFGTGKVTGEFAQETVCIGPEAVKIGPDGRPEGHGRCTDVNVVMAVEMTADPFKFFAFDGVFGLGLDGLALTSNFSFLSRLAESSSGLPPQFGVYLSDSDDSDGSELSMGGHNAARLRSPLSWVPVVAPNLGYWQVKINSIRLGDTDLDICHAGDCRGVVDTGTSLIGVPSAHFNTLDTQLSFLLPLDQPGANCREAKMPPLHIELDGFTMTLPAEEYMQNAATSNVTSKGGASSALTSQGNHCKPRLMPLNLQEPLGPNLFILGEPVMHSYYTVFDRKDLRIGFGLAARRGKEALGSLRLRGKGRDGLSDSGDAEAAVLLVQVRMRVRVRAAAV